LLYSDGPDLQRTYDSLDRLLTANNIILTRDAEGRVTSTDNPGVIFGATYDNGGRLSTATYPSTGSGQAFTVTYTYDSTTGLLSRVTDNLTNTQIDFTYDNDRRMIGITRSNGVNTTITWDNAGRPIRFQNGPSAGSGFIDLQYSLNGAGEVTQANITVPLDPATLLQGGTDTFTYDAASRVSTLGYSYDQRGRMTGAPGCTFTWDGDRLTGINSTTLAYNGLGDLITRTEAGTTIHYYYNYAIGLKPIVAEKNDSTGQFLRYYVWTPGGRLLYMIDAANGNKVYFYHFDLTGSTLGLTDSTGAVTDKYAYNSFGRLLSHQGSNPQPFTFVGRYGVRQEGSSGTLYHMRERYYDAVTQRFISREPLWPMIVDSRSINPYQYASNDPVRKLDFRGLKGGESVPEGALLDVYKGYGDLPSMFNPIGVALKIALRQQFMFFESVGSDADEKWDREMERWQREGMKKQQGQQEPVITPSAFIGQRESGRKGSAIAAGASPREVAPTAGPWTPRWNFVVVGGGEAKPPPEEPPAETLRLLPGWNLIILPRPIAEGRVAPLFEATPAR